MTDNETQIRQWVNMLREDADDIIKFLAEGDMDMVCFSANMALECSKRIAKLSETMENKDEI